MNSNIICSNHEMPLSFVVYDENSP